MRKIALAACTGGTIALMAASAATARPAATYTTWRAAQHAAGFTLLKPTQTFGLKRMGGILVTPCESTGQLRKRDVGASYGVTNHQLVAIEENNSGHPCSNFGEASYLGSYRVNGASAKLYGACGTPDTPPCSSPHIYLFLTWARHGIAYQATSHDKQRMALVTFARDLAPVPAADVNRPLASAHPW
jgi:hypothetical protein